ncbi:MAG: transcription termination/antitermination protein NusG [Treponema sp.]|nr:transcription termination/antitermination protein NusG [Treponema sp.]
MSRSWYILSVFTGYEGKIEKTIRLLLDKKELDSNVIYDVIVPEEEVLDVGKDGGVKIDKKTGKQKTRKVKFLPGYVMLEMDLPELTWKNTCAGLYAIQGVTGFVGNTNRNNRPKPISSDEAKNLLQKCGRIKGEKTVRINFTFNVGDSIKITEGPFASFPGVIKEIFADKEKLSVEVQIFGRSTPVEVTFSQVEKAN